MLFRINLIAGKEIRDQDDGMFLPVKLAKEIEIVNKLTLFLTGQNRRCRIFSGIAGYTS
jgi:hypothetical protein